MNISIRPVDAVKDAEALYAMRLERSVMNGIESVPSEPFEWIDGKLKDLDDFGHFFVAEADEHGEKKVVGHSMLRVQRCRRMRHSASVGIYIHPEYHHKGIGKALMDACLDVADNYLMLVRVELTVDTRNTWAIRLYESCGFEKEATLRKTTITNGLYTDDYLMARIRSCKED